MRCDTIRTISNTLILFRYEQLKLVLYLAGDCGVCRLEKYGYDCGSSAVASLEDNQFARMLKWIRKGPGENIVNTASMVDYTAKHGLALPGDEIRQYTLLGTSLGENAFLMDSEFFGHCWAMPTEITLLKLNGRVVLNCFVDHRDFPEIDRQLTRDTFAGFYYGRRVNEANEAGTSMTPRRIARVAYDEGLWRLSTTN